MTTAIYHGNPGSFKTASLVQSVIIPALYDGRTVIHNIRGLDDLEKIEKAFEKALPDSAKMLVIEHDSQAGFDEIARFFHFAPMGALIVIDEAQRVYPKTSRNLDQYNLDEKALNDTPVPRPMTVPEAFDRHRHFNWDIYLSTTNIGKIHPEVRLVAEWAYRLRNISGMLPWYKNKFRKFRHDPEQSGKSASHYDGTPETLTMDKKIFACYQSTATGTAKGSSISRSLFADRRIQFLGLLIVASLSGFIYMLSQVVEQRTTPTKTQPAVSPAQIPNVVALPVDRSHNSNLSQSVDTSVHSLEPFQEAEIFHVGNINKSDLFNVVYEDGRQLAVFDFELRALGYKVFPVKSCLVKIEYGQAFRYVTCPVPQEPKLETQPQLAHAVAF